MRELPKGPKLALILGAGFSVPAGLPAAAQLFEAEISGDSLASSQHIEQVRAAWRMWSKSHPASHPEEFMDSVASTWWNPPVDFGYVREFICLALAEPLRVFNPRLSQRYASTVLDGRTHPVYSPFWAILLSKRLRCIVTTNYDILVEQTFHGVQVTEFRRRRLYYGGFYGYPMQGVASIYRLGPDRIRRRPKRIEYRMTGDVPLFKLHGSLNWQDDHGTIRMYGDMRPAFKTRDVSLIVPPLPDKDTPPLLRPVWQRARECLSECGVWVICGYSMPEYDLKVNRLLAVSVQEARPTAILVLDPNSATISARWRTMAPDSHIRELDGLPLGLGDLAAAVEQLCKEE